MTVDLLWGYTGILTFGQSAFFGIGVYGVALVMAHYADGPTAIAGSILGSMAIAALLGAAVGWLAFGDRAHPIYASVVTLALPIVFTQVILSGGAFTGSSSGLPILAPFLMFEYWYWISGGLLFLMAALAYTFVSSDAGRIVVAIRENEERCRYLGVPVSRWKIALMAVCSAVGALAGGVYVLFGSAAAPQYGDFIFGTELLVWTALGGRGTLIGPIVGTVGINYVSAVLGGNLPFVWLLLVGILFVAVVVYLPSGLVPPVVNGVSTLVRGLGPGRRNKKADAGGNGGAPGQGAPRIITSPRPVAPADGGASGGQSGTAGQPVLELRNISKRYGSLEVLRGISLQAHRGELVAIIGPNGAGKTTLMRCIADGREPSEGDVLVNGRRLNGMLPEQCVVHGVGRKFQTPNLFDGLTVYDCLRVARSYRVPASLWRRTPYLELPEAAVYTLQVSGLMDMLDEPAGRLPHGLKQALEIAMVLSLEPSVLLLDEPTAGLSPEERMAMGAVLTDLSKNYDVCILLIEHDLDFVRDICTRLVVLHLGKLMLDGPISEVVGSELIRTVYVGGASSRG